MVDQQDGNVMPVRKLFEKSDVLIIICVQIAVTAGDIPDTTKQEAAELAVIYSSAYKAGTGAKVAVDTTEVKNIWKANGAKPGMVLYEVYTTVYITPRDGLAEQLKTTLQKR